jgi:hypothetical protein
MKDLIDYQRFQVEALQRKVCDLESKLNEVKTYVFELCEDDCPLEYKTIIKQQLYEISK